MTHGDPVDHLPIDLGPQSRRHRNRGDAISGRQRSIEEPICKVDLHRWRRVL